MTNSSQVTVGVMQRLPNRRSFMQGSAASLAGVALSGVGSRSRDACAADFKAPVQEARGLTAYHRDDTIQIRYDNLPIVGYRSQASLKYPYFYPLNGPQSGLSLTTESSLPYPHHRGLWLGCHPLNKGDYWADNGLDVGQIESTMLSITNTDADGVTFQQSCRWHGKFGNPFDDERRYIVKRFDESRWTIDCDFELTAREEIVINKAKHSFFAMRAAADISPAYGGTLFNSEGGTGAAGTYGKQAKWCGYFGARQLRPDVTEGIVIMNHPKNFGGDCPWFTRDYGHLSPSPLNFLDKPWTLAADGRIHLRYRVVLFAGTPQTAKLAQLYQSWLG